MSRGARRERFQSRFAHSQEVLENADRRIDFVKLLENIDDEFDRMMIAFLLTYAKEDAPVEELFRGTPITPDEVKKMYTNMIFKYPQLHNLPPDYTELQAYLHGEAKSFEPTKKLRINSASNTSSSGAAN